MPYTDVDEPDYIELLTYSELDALFELHGHIRATNPANQVIRRLAGQLSRTSTPRIWCPLAAWTGIRRPARAEAAATCRFSR